MSFSCILSLFGAGLAFDQLLLNNLVIPLSANDLGLERGCDECLPACTEISYSERPSAAPLNKALVERYTKSVALSQNRSAEYFT